MMAEVKDALPVELAEKFTKRGAEDSLADDEIAAQAEGSESSQGCCRGASWMRKLPVESEEVKVTVEDSPREGVRGKEMEKGETMAGQDTTSDERRGEKNKGPPGPAEPRVRA